MKISTKGRYALRMMLDLAENQHDGYVSLKDIAARQEISKKYFSKTFLLEGLFVVWAKTSIGQIKFTDEICSKIEKDKKIKEELIMLQDKIKGVYIGSKQEEKELNLKEETGKKYNLLTRAIKEKRKVKLLEK